MLEILIYFGGPFVAVLIAIGLAKLIFSKNYSLRMWHSYIGIGISGCIMFTVIGLLQNTRLEWPLMVTAGIVLVLSMAVRFTVENRKKQSDKKQNQNGPTNE